MVRPAAKRAPTLGEFLADENAVLRRGEAWNLIEIALRLERRNRWYWKLWRWVRGSKVVDTNPFRAIRAMRRS